MRSGGSFARGEDFGDGIRVMFRIQFLIFFFESARVFPGVARAAAMGSGMRVTRHDLNSGPFGEGVNFVLELSDCLVG
jgi:hypothetical protein